MVNQVNLYKNLCQKRELTRIDIWFLHRCLHENVTPTFARCRTSRNVPTRFKIEMEKKIIKKEICKHYAKLNRLNIDLKICYDNLTELLPFFALSNLLNKIYDLISRQKILKFQKLVRKLKDLRRKKHIIPNEQVFSDFKFHDRVLIYQIVSFLKMK